jgi:hypothetical protein
MVYKILGVSQWIHAFLNWVFQLSANPFRRDSSSPNTYGYVKCCEASGSPPQKIPGVIPLCACDNAETSDFQRSIKLLSKYHKEIFSV